LTTERSSWEAARLQGLFVRDQDITTDQHVVFAWRANSIAFWDNRAAQHYATSDYWPRRRVMGRVTIVGDTGVVTPRA
jgi:alpha-ketoglutarate-dependent taurine dioxygenase